MNVARTISSELVSRAERTNFHGWGRKIGSARWTERRTSVLGYENARQTHSRMCTGDVLLVNQMLGRTSENAKDPAHTAFCTTELSSSVEAHL